MVPETPSHQIQSIILGQRLGEFIYLMKKKIFSDFFLDENYQIFTLPTYDLNVMNKKPVC